MSEVIELSSDDDEDCVCVGNVWKDTSARRTEVTVFDSDSRSNPLALLPDDALFIAAGTFGEDVGTVEPLERIDLKIMRASEEDAGSGPYEQEDPFAVDKFQSESTEDAAVTERDEFIIPDCEEILEDTLRVGAPHPETFPVSSEAPILLPYDDCGVAGVSEADTERVAPMLSPQVKCRNQNMLHKESPGRPGDQNYCGMKAVSDGTAPRSSPQQQVRPGNKSRGRPRRGNIVAQRRTIRTRSNDPGIVVEKCMSEKFDLNLIAERLANVLQKANPCAESNLQLNNIGTNPFQTNVESSNTDIDRRPARAVSSRRLSNIEACILDVSNGNFSMEGRCERILRRKTSNESNTSVGTVAREPHREEAVSVQTHQDATTANYQGSSTPLPDHQTNSREKRGLNRPKRKRTKKNLAQSSTSSERETKIRESLHTASDSGTLSCSSPESADRAYNKLKFTRDKKSGNLSVSVVSPCQNSPESLPTPLSDENGTQLSSRNEEHTSSNQLNYEASSMVSTNSKTFSIHNYPDSSRLWRTGNPAGGNMTSAVKQTSTLEQILLSSPTEVDRRRAEFVKCYYIVFDEVGEQLCLKMADLLLLTMRESRNFKRRIENAHKLKEEEVKRAEVDAAEDACDETITIFKEKFNDLFCQLYAKIFNPDIVSDQQHALVICWFVKIFLRVISIDPDLEESLLEARVNVKVLLCDFQNLHTLSVLLDSKEMELEKNCFIVLDFMGQCFVEDRDKNKNNDVASVVTSRCLPENNEHSKSQLTDFERPNSNSLANALQMSMKPRETAPSANTDTSQQLSGSPTTFICSQNISFPSKIPEATGNVPGRTCVPVSVIVRDENKVRDQNFKQHGSTENLEIQHGLKQHQLTEIVEQPSSRYTLERLQNPMGATVSPQSNLEEKVLEQLFNDHLHQARFQHPGQIKRKVHADFESRKIQKIHPVVSPVQMNSSVPSLVQTAQYSVNDSSNLPRTSASPVSQNLDARVVQTANVKHSEGEVVINRIPNPYVTTVGGLTQEEYERLPAISKERFVKSAYKCCDWYQNVDNHANDLLTTSVHNSGPTVNNYPTNTNYPKVETCPTPFAYPQKAISNKSTYHTNAPSTNPTNYPTYMNYPANVPPSTKPTHPHNIVPINYSTQTTYQSNVRSGITPSAYTNSSNQPPPMDYSCNVAPTPTPTLPLNSISNYPARTSAPNNIPVAARNTVPKHYPNYTNYPRNVPASSTPTSYSRYYSYPGKAMTYSMDYAPPPYNSQHYTDVQYPSATVQYPPPHQQQGYHAQNSKTQSPIGAQRGVPPASDASAGGVTINNINITTYIPPEYEDGMKKKIRDFYQRIDQQMKPTTDDCQKKNEVNQRPPTNLPRFHATFLQQSPSSKHDV